MSSRLATDQRGRTIVVVTTPSLWLTVGDRFFVLDGTPFGLVPERSRRPTARDRAASAKFFYDSNSAKRQRAQLVDVLDDELDEQAALEAARLEQQRRPRTGRRPIRATTAIPVLASST